MDERTDEGRGGPGKDDRAPPGSDGDLQPAELLAPAGGGAGERRALGILALAALALIAWLAHAVAVGILLGALTGFSLDPFYQWLLGKKFRPAGAALSCVALAAGGFVFILGGLGSLLVVRGAVIAQALIASFEPGQPARLTLDRLVLRLGLKSQSDHLAAKLRDAASEIASRLAAMAAVVAERTFGALLVLFFSMMTLYFVLRHWRRLERTVVDCLPLHPRHSTALLAELRRAGRTTLLGTIVTGVTQGTLAGLGYALCGVPEPVFFGAVTVVASLLPGVGTLLVWVPLGVFLLLTGHPVAGIAELAWGAVVVVLISDYVIRPRLVGGRGEMPALFTFAALFGGVEVLGLSGLIFGPLCMSLAFALLRIYAREVRDARKSTASAEAAEAAAPTDPNA